MKKLVGIGLIFFLVLVPPCFAATEEGGIPSFASETLLQELAEELAQWIRETMASYTEKSSNTPVGHEGALEPPGSGQPESGPDTSAAEPDDLPEIGPGMEPIG